MRRTYSRIAGGIVVAATALVALAGCGGGGGSQPSGDGGSATSGTVNWWSWTPDNNVAEREIAAFNKQYPDIKVIYKKVPERQLRGCAEARARVRTTARMSTPSTPAAPSRPRPSRRTPTT